MIFSICHFWFLFHCQRLLSSPWSFQNILSFVLRTVFGNFCTFEAYKCNHVVIKFLLTKLKEGTLMPCGKYEVSLLVWYLPNDWSLFRCKAIQSLMVLPVLILFIIELAKSKVCHRFRRLCTCVGWPWYHELHRCCQPSLQRTCCYKLFLCWHIQ